MTEIGIIGGGQLARMMIYRSAHLGLDFTVLDPDSKCSASSLTPHLITGRLNDEASLRKLAGSARILTYDIEHIDAQILLKLETEGVIIFPSPRLLAVVQDKLIQKKTLAATGVPQPRFWESDPGVRPAVEKTRRGGYDGRGVTLHKINGIPSPVADTYWEEWIDTEKEIAVIAVLGQSGIPVFYPPVEMVFDPESNICDQVLLPARIPENIISQALDAAKKTIQSLSPLGLRGVLAIEMFLTKSGEILVNEVAPRPHNSGHVTMETSDICQFEAHIRAISGYPLPQPVTHRAGWMKNLLGTGIGRPKLLGGEILQYGNVKLHLYGKPECRTGRKMGHVTITASTPEEALEFSKTTANLKVSAL